MWASIHSTSDVDWYSVRAHDVGDACVFGENHRFAAWLDYVPVSRDYDLYAYWDTGAGAAQSTNGGNASEHLDVTWEGSWLGDDTRHLCKVQRFWGDPTTQTYRLTLRLTETCK